MSITKCTECNKIIGNTDTIYDASYNGLNCPICPICDDCWNEDKSTQKIIEKNFKTMLNINPKKMCYNALVDQLAMLESEGINTVKMREWVEEKKNRPGVQVYILPLSK